MTGGGGDGKEKVSVANVALNMSNAIIGAGIVGLPYALKEAGCGLGLMLLVAMAWVTNYSIGCLIASAAFDRASADLFNKNRAS